MKRRCEACRGVGFLLMRNDVHGLRIERCDTCRKFRSDDAAVTAAFKAAVGRSARRYKRLPDADIRQRWDLDCRCERVERSVYVEPAFYASSGTPICEACGADRKYVRTEVRPCGHSHA